MTDKERALLAVEALEKKYPDAICSLNAMNPLQLLIATRLSAQCTDARVNLVTPALFEKYKTAEDFAAAAPEDVEALIRSCGFFRTKARDIIGMCRKIIDDFGGKVPDSIEALTSLPGVGRKTANLIMGDIYGEPAVVADTHLIRISNLLGLVSTKDPYKVELRLRELLPPEKSNDFCHRCVLHGRDTCVAGRPKCGECVMSGFCAKVLSNDDSRNAAALTAAPMHAATLIFSAARSLFLRSLTAGGIPALWAIIVARSLRSPSLTAEYSGFIKNRTFSKYSH